MVRVIPDYLEKAYKLYPSKTAFFNTEQSCSYRDLHYSSILIASSIIKRGIFKSPILIYMSAGYDCVSCMFGVLYSCNYFAIVSDDLPPQRIGEIISDFAPSVVIASNKNKIIKSFENVQSRILWYEDIIQGDYIDYKKIREIKNRILSIDPAFVVYTSGSTGVPKGVVVSHKAVLSYIGLYIELTGFSCESKCVEINSNVFSFYIYDAFVTVAGCGSEMILSPKVMFSPTELLSYIEKYEIDTINCITSVLTLLAKLDCLKDNRINSLKTVFFGGERLDANVIDYWKKYLPNAIYYSCCGATEVQFICINILDNKEKRFGEEITLGKVAPDTELILVNEDMKCVNEGCVGEMLVRGIRVTSGYYRDIEKTRSAFVQNPLHNDYIDIVFRSGDLIKKSPSGDYVYVGRKDSLIKKHGHRIELGEIEKRTISIEGVDETSCIFSEEEQVIVLYYVGLITPMELHNELRNTLSIGMMPDKIICLESLPRNNNSKIDRLILKKMYSEGGIHYGDDNSNC